jgi:hypothetical protein
MNTYLAADRRAYDGIFVLSEAQVERIIENSRLVSSSLSMQISLVKQALLGALSAASEPPGRADLARWASNIVTRLRSAVRRTGTLASEDVTTADFAEVVNGARTSGAWVQIEPRAFSAYISFGSLRIHLEGRLTAEPASQGCPELIRVSLRSSIRDVFDFHLTREDDGTGWMDHALSRLQGAGYAKPFRIEGVGRPRGFVVRTA